MFPNTANEREYLDEVKAKSINYCKYCKKETESFGGDEEMFCSECDAFKGMAGDQDE